MRILGWSTVGLFYIAMVWRNFASVTRLALTCPSWPFCSLTVTPAMNTAFFIASILLFSGLIALACVITWGNPVVKQIPDKTNKTTQITKIRRLALSGIFGLLVQFVLGSQVRQNAGGLACPNFPNCLESFLPSPLTFETLLAFTHRWWGLLLLGHFFTLAITAAKTAPSLAGPTRRVFALSVAQVFLGIGTVLGGLNSDSRALHAAVGYALWGILFFIAIRAGGFRWLWTPFVKASETP